MRLEGEGFGLRGMTLPSGHLETKDKWPEAQRGVDREEFGADKESGRVGGGMGPKGARRAQLANPGDRLGTEARHLGPVFKLHLCQFFPQDSSEASAGLQASLSEGTRTPQLPQGAAPICRSSIRASRLPISTTRSCST